MSKKEVHTAIVTRNTDDDLGTSLRGSVFFDAPSLFEGEFPLPASPCFPFASAGGAGMFFVPQVGDEIEIEIEADDGSDDTTDVELPEPTWKCMVYSEAADIDEVFKTNYTKRMGWKTNSGAMLLFDDTAGEEFVSIVSSKGHEITLDDTEGVEAILFHSKKGHEMIFDDLNDEIVISHQSGAIIKLTADKIEIEQGTESIVLESGKITSKASAEFVADSPIVKLGTGAGFHASLSENVIGLHDMHIHPPHPILIGGPITPPVVPMSSKAGTPLDPTALSILLKGNT